MTANLIIALFRPDNSQKIARDTYIWAILSGVIYAASSFVMGMAVNSILGGEMGGIFTVAVTINNQFVTIAYFNMRAYQASDVEGKYCFSDYLYSRVITCAIMVIVCVFLIQTADFPKYEANAIFLFLVFRVAETFADVLEGLYQQHMRYDTACKAVFFETIFSMTAFLCGLVIIGDLLVSLAIMDAVYILSILIIDVSLARSFENARLKFSFSRVRSLLKDCLPLFASSFFLMYIVNESKYAVFDMYPYEETAKYGAVFMMASVVQMFSSFVQKPAITSMSLCYTSDDLKGRKRFWNMVSRQVVFTGLITLICIVGAALVGIHVLTTLNGLDLSGYEDVLLVVILGGGFYAICQLLQYICVIMRRQKRYMIACIIIAILSSMLVPEITEKLGMNGAAISYAGSMVAMSLLLLLFAKIPLMQKNKKNACKGKNSVL